MNKNILLLFLVILLSQLGNLMDVTEEPVVSDIIVSLGGDNGARIKKTLQLYNLNYSKSNKIILTGIDNFDSSMNQYELDWRIEYMKKKGLHENDILINSKARNTLEEMAYIKKFLIESNLTTVLLISDQPHSRRISFFANTVLNYEKSGIKLTIVESENNYWESNLYFLHPEAIIFVFNESIKLIYYFTQYILGELDE